MDNFLKTIAPRRHHSRDAYGMWVNYPILGLKVDMGVDLLWFSMRHRVWRTLCKKSIPRSATTPVASIIP